MFQLSSLMFCDVEVGFSLVKWLEHELDVTHYFTSSTFERQLAVKITDMW